LDGKNVLIILGITPYFRDSLNSWQKNIVTLHSWIKRFDVKTGYFLIGLGNIGNIGQHSFSQKKTPMQKKETFGKVVFLVDFKYETFWRGGGFWIYPCSPGRSVHRSLVKSSLEFLWCKTLSQVFDLTETLSSFQHIKLAFTWLHCILV
jgi:hypothetical protein